MSDKDKSNGGPQCSGCGKKLTPKNESVSNGGVCKDCDPECNDDDK